MSHTAAEAAHKLYEASPDVTPYAAMGAEEREVYHQKLITIGEVSAIMGAGSFRLDPSMAAHTGRITVENNFVAHLVAYAVLPLVEAGAAVLAGTGVLAAGYKLIKAAKDIIDGADAPQLPGMAPGPEDLLGPRVNATPAHRADLGAGVESFPAQDPQRPQVMGTPVTQERPTILSTPVDTGVRATVFLNESSNDGQGKSRRELHGYHVPPKTLEAFPDAIKTKSKTPVVGGGGLRARWEDKKYIYEWDSRHGTVEKYTKSTQEHRGEYDYKTGDQIKPANPKRKIEK